MHEQTTDKSEIIGMPKIKTTKVVCPQSYSYILLKELQNEGLKKTDYTERKVVDKKIYEQTHGQSKLAKVKLCPN